MKKIRHCITCCLLVLGLSLSMGVCVRGAKAVDYALHTDIVAQINGHPIRSYNIGGYTAVVAEDLRGYGFHVIWHGDTRTLHITRATRNWELETPEIWPDYVPHGLSRPVGTRAKAVYDTDIVTYAAGQLIKSFNIDGETLVWMDDLTAFGAVVWDDAERVIALTLCDPMELALEKKISNVESWREIGGAGSEWKTWPVRTGTLLYTCYTGTTHGVSKDLIFVKKNGEQIRILDLLPQYGWGQGYYVNPRDIELDEMGETLTFITPVKETDEESDGGVKDWGDTLCRINLNTGQMISMQPLAQGLTDWSLTLLPDAQSDTGDGVSIAIARTGAEVYAVSEKYPGVNMNVAWSVNGITVVHRAAMFLEEGSMETDYGKTWQKLRQIGLPDTTAGNDITNSPELRDAVREHITVRHNDRIITGDVWWSRGNNHIDLNITFDRPMQLLDGDTAELIIAG